MDGEGRMVMSGRLDIKEYMRVLERALVDLRGVKYLGRIKAKVVGESVGKKGGG